MIDYFLNKASLNISQSFEAVYDSASPRLDPREDEEEKEVAIFAYVDSKRPSL